LRKAGLKKSGLAWEDFDGKASSGKAAQQKATGDSGSDSDSGDEDDEDEDTAGGDKKSKKRNKKDAAAKKEKHLREQERALADGSDLPRSAKEFDRMLVGNPNSSFMWIQYMAMHAQSADIERARATARRALDAINFREDEEKFNVWMAWVALEFQYGDMANLDKVFRQACQQSKSKVLHLKLASMYEESGDHEAAKAMFDRALKVKKLKKSKQVWAAYQRFSIRRGMISEAKALLARSMQSLSKHKHVYVIQNYAFAEFDLGDPERGRLLFEELLSASPKRLDMWHVYVDKEVKCGNIERARSLFDRMTTLKMSTKSITALFKKYLLFEKQHGTESSTLSGPAMK
jgi:rRNA biogenesis protein RRP5